LYLLLLTSSVVIAMHSCLSNSGFFPTKNWSLTTSGRSSS